MRFLSLWKIVENSIAFMEFLMAMVDRSVPNSLKITSVTI